VISNKADIRNSCSDMSIEMLGRESGGVALAKVNHIKVQHHTELAYLESHPGRCYLELPVPRPVLLYP
jgi:hypothetical protein